MHDLGLFHSLSLKLANLSCPFCLDGHLDLRLSCTVPGCDCDYIAQCERCHIEYRLDCDSNRSSTCRSCGTAVRGAIECDVSTRSCTLLDVCESCSPA